MGDRVTVVPLSRDQVRQVDRRAVAELGIPSLLLMENAGRSATAAVRGLLGEAWGLEPDQARVAVLCGGGNNGGDGYVMARHLYNQRAAVVIYAAKDPATLVGDAAVNHQICTKIGLKVCPVLNEKQLAAEAPHWEESHIVVDALFGTGFTGAVRPHLASVINQCNDLAGPRVVAVDVPSGLDCDTGRPAAATIRADVTVSFVAPKRGFANPKAAEYVGKIVVGDIGIPPQWVQQVSQA